MRFTKTLKGALLCSATAAFALPAMAQDDEAFALDPIWLAQSKREVQTETATSITTVDQEEMDDRQASTIAELVDSVPGVTLINGASPQGSGINIRGFGANSTYGSDQKVLIQVDDADVGAEELYRIGTQLYTDPQLYKKVDVVRGIAGTLEFGSGAIGGLVRLQTKDASDFTGGEIGMKARQTLQYTSNGNGITSSTILAWQPTADFELLAHYSYSERDDYEDGSGTTIGNTGFELPSWQVKARKTFGDGSHALTFSLTDTNSEEKDVPYDSFQTTSGSFGNVDRDIHTRTATLKYEYNPADNDLINLSATLSYADQKIDQAYVPGSSPLEVTPTFPFLQPLVDADHRYETTKFTLKNTAEFETGAFGHNLRAGVEFKQKDRKDASSAPGGTDERMALFLVDDITTGGLTLTPALRYESQDIRGGGASYSNDATMGALSAHYAFDNGFAVFASAAYTESLPILDDLGTPAYMTQSEKARSLEFGIAYDKGSVFTEGDDLSFKVTSYRTRMWDVTSATAPTMMPITDVKLDGVELEAAYSLESGYYVDVNANLADGEYTSPAPGGEWRGVPADSLRLTLGKKWGETLDLSWEVVANDSMNKAATPTPSWTAHNLRATFKPQTGVFEGTEVRVGVENVFDKTYRPHLATYNAPGRTLKLTLAKTF